MTNFIKEITVFDRLSRFIKLSENDSGFFILYYFVKNLMTKIEENTVFFVNRKVISLNMRFPAY